MIGQSAALNLNNEQLQVLLTGKFGDGCLVVPRSENSNSYYLNKYYVDCYNYKIWSSETIQNWSKMQEYLKSENKSQCSNRMKSSILKKIEQGLL